MIEQVCFSYIECIEQNVWAKIAISYNFGRLCFDLLNVSNHKKQLKIV